MRFPKLFTVVALVVGLVVSVAHGQSPRPQTSAITHPDWALRSVVYQLDPRQFTPEGTFRAILPRVQELKDLGVGVVLFTPIHPIGKKGRQGELGDPYSVQSHTTVNPEMGTMEDYKAVVRALHQAGLHVVMDLVAHQTSLDHLLTLEHPEWYVRTAAGKPVSPPGATDVLMLDYSHPGLREYMGQVMEFWVRDVGVDGFRCDGAARVPPEFWRDARRRLAAVRPVVLLGDLHKPELLANTFDADFGLEYCRLFDQVAHAKAAPLALDRLLGEDARKYPRGSWRVLFTSDYGQNRNVDSDVHMLGEDGAKAFAVLAFTLPGQPLLFNGQEVGNSRKLAPFSRDPITWGASDFRPFYRSLCQIRNSQPSLQDGSMGRIRAEGSARVFGFIRSRPGSDAVVVAVNLSSQAAHVGLAVPAAARSLVDLFENRTFPVKKGFPPVVDLRPWGTRIFRVVTK